MQLNKLAGEVAGADSIRKPQGAPVPNAPGVAPDAESKGDRVQISDAGRALSADASAEHASESTLDPKQVDDIRAKILSGAYNSLEMAHNVARSILRSGDL